MSAALAFGDSLTWGARPDSPARHAYDDRWPNVLAGHLSGTEVISEGLRGRTTCFDQPSYPAQMNGGALLPSLIDSHAPLDAVLIMLGSNDIYFGFGPVRAAEGLARLVEMIRHHPFRMGTLAPPDILLIAPPAMVPSDLGDVSPQMIAASAAYPKLIADLADEAGCGYFDAGSVAVASPLDGIHLDAANTRAIGLGLADPLRALLGARGEAGP